MILKITIQGQQNQQLAKFMALQTQFPSIFFLENLIKLCKLHSKNIKFTSWKMVILTFFSGILK